MKLIRSVFWLLIIALAAAGCDGLAGEPEIVATIPPAPTRPPQPQEISLPTGAINITAGAEIYATECVRCHGELGTGDGEFVTSGQITEISDFTDPLVARPQTPQEWFMTITNGRLDKLMPPWADSLTAGQRWDVAMYTYTLAYQPEQLTRGEAIWETQCADCHGTNGEGTDTGPALGDLVELSDDTIFAQVTRGQGEMPAFAEDLNEQDRWDVIAYARMLSLETEPDVAVAEAPTAENTVATIGGSVTNGTINGPIPDDLVITLHVMDETFNDSPVETTVDALGFFLFPDVPVSADKIYFLTTTYQDVVYSTEPAHGDPEFAIVDVPLTIYETTHDSNVIEVSTLINQYQPFDETQMQVMQIMNFHNTSDRVYLRDIKSDNGRNVSIEVAVPEGSEVMDFGDITRRFVWGESPYYLFDTQPVFPGEDHVAHVVYTTPYTDGLVFNLPLSYNLNGPVEITLPDGLELTSNSLEEVSGSGAFKTYRGDLALGKGDILSYDVQGKIVSPTTTTATSSGSSTTDTNTLLAVGLMVAGFGMIALAGAMFYRTSRIPQTTEDKGVNPLVQQIAELDMQFQEGKIDETDYHNRRSALKDMLIHSMKDA